MDDRVCVRCYWRTFAARDGYTSSFLAARLAQRQRRVGTLEKLWRHHKTTGSSNNSNQL